MKTFIVNIEQPLFKGFEIKAKDEEQAEEIAREKYSKGELVLNNDDLGTDAVFQVCDKKGEPLTEWN